MSVCELEAGKVTPSLVMLNKIVIALDRDLASFFGLEIDEHKLVLTPEDRIKVEGDALRGGTGVTWTPLTQSLLLDTGEEQETAWVSIGVAVGAPGQRTYRVDALSVTFTRR